MGNLHQIIMGVVQVAQPFVICLLGWLGFRWIANQNDTPEAHARYPSYRGIATSFRRSSWIWLVVGSALALNELRSVMK